MNILKIIVLFIYINLFNSKIGHAQFVFPNEIERAHPRLISSKLNQLNILESKNSSEAYKTSFESIKKKISNYVTQYEKDSDWLSSRFQMYWKSHATKVYVDGEFYSHAKGKAPVPTVRFTGQRDYVTDYKTPKLEDVIPYNEDKRGLYLENKKTGKWEWVKASKTGRVIENTNENIMRIARDAALVYFVEGDEEYAKLATHLFDVYMQGLFYRNEPVDLKKGKVQNVIGLTSFQVIKENIVDELAETFDFLYSYLQENKKEQLPIYTTSLKKLAEIIIKNGVPDNNWNLHQANYVIQIALVLDNDKNYKDSRGCQYYLNRIFNASEARQWSVNDVLAYGYDQNNGIWNESAGYALSVAKGFTELAIVIQEALDVDIMPNMPIIPKAVSIMPQYLYPNKSIVAFGDSHYGPLNAQPFLDLIKNAQQFNKRNQEEKYTALLYLLKGEINELKKGKNNKNAFFNLLHNAEVNLDSSIKSADINNYITNSFYAPNVSWVAMRNGFDEKHGLMISQVGSLGNHAHSNGIAMELYGKGYILGPEGGRGSSYFQNDYRQYYSQFPAHNTVSVNGKSQYNKMRSYYAFEINSLYPKSEQKTGYYPNVNFSDIYFHEPSTNSDQNRVMSIIRTGETSGYYLDIFRSKQKEGNNKYHDYFYHNLGQDLSFTTTDNQTLKLNKSSKLTSKEGNIKAYDYLTNEVSINTHQNFNASYNLSIKDKENVKMNIWIQGQENRELFKVSSPPSEAFRNEVIPKEIEKLPLLTTVVRQYGEAWNKPFVAVYEPSSSKETKTISSVKSFDIANGNSSSFVGLEVLSKTNRTDYIFSSDLFDTYNYNDIDFTGTFGLLTQEANTVTLFIGAGKELSYNDYTIEVLGKKSSSATLVIAKQLKIVCDAAVLLTVPDSYKKGDVVLNIGFKQLHGERSQLNGKKVVQFKVPPIDFQNISIKLKD